MHIVVDGNKVQFTQADFPMLISGAPGAGSSYFSIELMVELAKNGEQVVLFSAYEQAKELFREEMGENIGENVMIIESGDGDSFLKQISTIENIDDRIILFKNIDNYDTGLFTALKDKPLAVFSGDLDACSFKDDLLKKEFKTRIFFSYPEGVEVEKKIDLPKYSAHIISDRFNGLIAVSKQ